MKSKEKSNKILAKQKDEFDQKVLQIKHDITKITQDLDGRSQEEMVTQGYAKKKLQPLY